jgi:hypothetical protein
MRRLLSALSLLVLAAGCDSPYDPTAGSSGVAVPGAYVLRTVNGLTLPYTYSRSGADSYELLDDTFTLADSTWTEVWHERHTVSGVVTTPTYSDAGTYTLNGTSIAFTSTTPGTIQSSFAGSVAGGTLYLPGQAVSSGGPVEAMVYTK